MSGTITVRSGEEFDLEKVESYLRAQIPDMDAGPLVVEQFAAGHSNLTYLLRAGSWQAVLRRPPLGPVAPKAHDMARESRLLSALSPLFPLAPKPYHFCADTELLGSPFFVMERKSGIIADREWPSAFAQTEANARLMSEAAIDTLVALHQVEYEGTPLAEIGHPDGYMERQVNGWAQRYERSQTEEIPEAEKVALWMQKHLPKQITPTVIHNDFKLNNMLFSEAHPGTATAVLDWEMATIGDPLSDLAVTLSYWAEADDPEVLRDGLSPLSALPGFHTRKELIELYAKKSGRDVQAMDFYLTFAYFKVAVICQQIYHRYALGQTNDPRFAAMGERAKKLIQLAWQTAGESLE